MSHVFRRPDDYRAKPSPLFMLLAVASAASGIAAVTITATGPLLGSGQLAGSCSIGLTAEAAASGSNLSGSSLNTFGGTGLIGAIGGAAGTCAITFANSATPGGAVAYPLAQRLALRKWRPELPDFTLYQNRVLILSLATEAGVSGQTDIAFTPTGTLIAAGGLAGTASATFGGTGPLRAAGALAGLAASTFTPTGALTNGATGVITGVAAMEFGGTGAVLGSGSLGGVSLVSFTASMFGSSVQLVTGVATVTLSASGTVSGALGAFGNPDAIYLRVDESRSVFLTVRNA